VTWGIGAFKKAANTWGVRKGGQYMGPSKRWPIHGPFAWAANYTWGLRREAQSMGPFKGQPIHGVFEGAANTREN